MSDLLDALEGVDDAIAAMSNGLIGTGVDRRVDTRSYNRLRDLFRDLEEAVSCLHIVIENQSKGM